MATQLGCLSQPFTALFAESATSVRHGDPSKLKCVESDSFAPGFLA